MQGHIIRQKSLCNSVINFFNAVVIKICLMPSASYIYNWRNKTVIRPRRGRMFLSHHRLYDGKKQETRTIQCRRTKTPCNSVINSVNAVVIIICQMPAASNIYTVKAERRFDPGVDRIFLSQHSVTQGQVIRQRSLCNSVINSFNAVVKHNVSDASGIKYL